jgi:hypothetical protein
MRSGLAGGIRSAHATANRWTKQKQLDSPHRADIFGLWKTKLSRQLRSLRRRNNLNPVLLDGEFVTLVTACAICL